MTKEELARRVREVSYLTGEFKLRSGKVSSFYWDKYRFESDPAVIGGAGSGDGVAFADGFR